LARFPGLELSVGELLQKAKYLPVDRRFASAERRHDWVEEHRVIDLFILSAAI